MTRTLGSILALVLHELREILGADPSPEAGTALLVVLVCGLGLGAVCVLCADVMPALLDGMR